MPCSSQTFMATSMPVQPSVLRSACVLPFGAVEKLATLKAELER